MVHCYFQLPFSGLCTGCNGSIGKGTSFWAIKEAMEDPHGGRPVLQFTMWCCRCCKVEFLIRTNPEKRGFDCVKGIRKQRKRPRNEAAALNSENADAQAENDTIHHETDVEMLEKLHERKRKMSHESDINAYLRASFRKERKERKFRQSAAQSIGWKPGNELLQRCAEDTKQACSVPLKNSKLQEQSQLRNIRASSIFQSKRGRRVRPRRGSGTTAVTSESASLGNPQHHPEAVISKSRTTQGIGVGRVSRDNVSADTNFPTCVSSSRVVPDSVSSCNASPLAIVQKRNPKKRIMHLSVKQIEEHKSKSSGVAVSKNLKMGNSSISPLQALADYTSDSD